MASTGLEGLSSICQGGHLIICPKHNLCFTDIRFPPFPLMEPPKVAIEGRETTSQLINFERDVQWPLIQLRGLEPNRWFEGVLGGGGKFCPLQEGDQTPKPQIQTS